MNFLQQLAATAIRNQVVSALRGNCPAAITASLEQLLADDAAVNSIRDFVMANLKNPTAINAESLKNLAYSEKTAALLQSAPALLSYLADTARAKLPK